jgi:3-dehydrotetronate 4-kinase
MDNKLLLGCIADDFTGGTDLANNLVRAGMRVVQTIGVPRAAVAEVDAVVVALKSRTIPAADAVGQSVEALRWLQAQGCRQFYFKVCSTFDSTPQGNIGPVAEALLEALGADFCCVTPAFPENGRTIYKGHLFVGDVLLAESGMRNHPLTPMTESNLVRVMQAQSRGRVGLVEHRDVREGAERIRARLAQLRAEGLRFAVVDAIADDDLLALARAVDDAPLMVAGSGLAIGLPRNHGLKPSPQAAALPKAEGLRAIISGSCSVATQAQVADFVGHGGAGRALDPLQLADDRAGVIAATLAWAEAHLRDGPVLVYSTDRPESVRAVQERLGVQQAGALVEEALAAVGKGLVERGVRRLVVAGGETSGAVVQALGIEQLRIGPQIDPGVPWCHAAATACRTQLHLALKSGNFGSTDFFRKSFSLLA